MPSEPALLTNLMENYIAHLCAAVPQIQEVWLFGSRANGRWLPNSDWDLLAVGGPLLREELANHIEFQVPNVDLFIQDETGEIRAPWPGSTKTLSEAKWEKRSATRANYLSSKPKYGPNGDELFSSELRQDTAIRVWPT